MKPKAGKMVVSLDFELMWGVRDMATKKDYGPNILGVRQALPAILDYFERYGIRGTFAVVGLLFFESKQAMLSGLPTQMPQYQDPNFSPYGTYMAHEVGADVLADPYHFAPDLIRLLMKSPGQEIATHTFSHFYCLEKGQTIRDFERDLQAAIDVSASQDIPITSIIFPRNQVNTAYLGACQQKGIIAFRGNEQSWLYANGTGNKESLFRRFFRLADAYINITGHHCYGDDYMKKGQVINIPSTRFLRPYSPKLRFLEKLRLKRICNGMTHAAKNGLLYHLWWHPHNFGVNLSENLSFLEQVLQHYTHLEKEYGFKSHTMSEYARELLKD